MPKKGEKEDNEEENKDELTNNFENLNLDEASSKTQIAENNNNTRQTEENAENSGSGEEGDENEEDDDDGWIKPSNLDQVKKKSILDLEQQELTDLHFKVACMTSDFAMQNVLLQIGIPILSVDGLLIKKPRSYVLKCISCYK
jgi:RNA-binding protein NOB1